MSKNTLNLGAFKPLAVNKVGQFSIKGGGTYEFIGWANQGTAASTVDVRRDDDKVACDLPDTYGNAEFDAHKNWH